MLHSSFKEALANEQKEDIDQLKQLLIDYNSNFKQLERIGFMARNLTVDSLKTGPNGNILVTLLFDKNKSDSSFSFKSGDIVLLSRGSNNLKECLSKMQVQGNVYKQRKDSVTILLESEMASGDVTIDDSVSYFVVKTINEITYKRMFKTLEMLKKCEESYENQSISNPFLLQVLLNKLDAKEVKNQLKYSAFPEIAIENRNLNDSQVAAVKFAINNPISIIHGPFACGKTSTIVEIIHQLNKSQTHKGKVLICGPSNVSVDTILEKLDRAGGVKPGQMLRIGNPTRITSNAKYSVDNIVSNGENGLLCKDIKNEINALLKTNNSRGSAKSKKSTRVNAKNATKTGLSRGSKWSEIKSLRKDLVVRENKIIKELMASSRFIFATLHGSSNRQVLSLYDDESGDSANHIETLIIDEVSQSLEIQCWIPILTHLKHLKRVILAGDNKQLPPTIKCESNPALKGSFSALNRTLFDRLEEIYGSTFIKFLNTQYRMNEAIMEFPSAVMYGGRVVSGDSNRHILLADLVSGDSKDSDRNSDKNSDRNNDKNSERKNDKNSDQNHDNNNAHNTYHNIDNNNAKNDTQIHRADYDEFLNEPLIWYDTQCDLSFMEDRSDDVSGGTRSELFASKSNRNEVAVALSHVRRLVSEMNLREEHIGIITPYQAQVALMKEAIHEEYPDVEIHTVDGFQGNEKECIIMSLVRFNEDQELGFIKDERRLNVAMTRAKRQLCVIGNLEMLAVSKNSNVFLRRWCAFMEARAAVEYPEVPK